MPELISLFVTIVALELGPLSLRTNVDDLSFQVYPFSHELMVEIVRW
jgi:hypothetical protein